MRDVPAVPVNKLNPGDVVMFNNAHTAVVDSIEKITPHSFRIGLISEEFDPIVLYETRRGKTLMTRVN